MRILETERLVIRPLAMEDLLPLHRMLDVELQWAGRVLSVEERKAALSDHIADARLNSPFGHSAVVAKSSDVLIGWFRFGPNFDYLDDPSLPIERRVRSLEVGIGYAFTASEQRKGYATEAATAVVRHAFGDLAIGRIVAYTSQSNVRSIRLMERLGMQVAKNPRPGWETRMVGILVRQENAVL